MQLQEVLAITGYLIEISAKLFCPGEDMEFDFFLQYLGPYVFMRKALLCLVHHLLTYLLLLKGCVIFNFLVPTAYLSAARLTVKPFLEFKIKKEQRKREKNKLKKSCHLSHFKIYQMKPLQKC